MRRRWLTSKERDVPAFQAPFEIKNKQGVECDAIPQPLTRPIPLSSYLRYERQLSVSTRVSFI